jgi:hypothetical protein
MDTHHHMLLGLPALLGFMGVDATATAPVLLAIVLPAAFWAARNWHRVQAWLQDAWAGRRMRKLSFRGRIVSCRTNTYVIMPDAMKAVCHHAHTRMDALLGVRSVEAIPVGCDGDTRNVPVQRGWVDLGGGVLLSIVKELKDDAPVQMASSSGWRTDTVEVTATLKTSHDAGYAHLMRFVDRCTADYKATKVQTAHMVFVYRRTLEQGVPQFDAYAFDSNKTFANTAFEGMEALVERVRVFESAEGRARSHRLGIQHALGLFFHGAPGTGKTSAIKSIANMTGRHLVVVRMDAVLRQHYDDGGGDGEGCDAVDALCSIMRSPRINDVEIPQGRRLYVFEEADTWQALLTLPPPRRAKRAADAAAQVDVDAERVASLRTHVLGGLLELMDGLVEAPGRMCVMTSNHPEALDPALLRPGRFGDVRHEFVRMSPESVSAMHRLWFGCDMPADEMAALRCVQPQTQAEVGQAFAARPFLCNASS